MKLTLIFLILTCLFFINSIPSTPRWPDQFEQSFTEKFSYAFLKGTTKGNFFYDWPTRRYRVDRENGKYDRFCGSIYKFQDTPCSHIVADGNRYLYFPDKNYCCKCCENKDGCGVLKPDWLEGGKFIDLEKDTNGVYLEKWDKPGMQSNFYWGVHSNVEEERIMRRVDQVPNDMQDFDVSSFYRGIRDHKVFDLPSKCDPNFKCSWFSVCTITRGLR